jgi:hypothetical protein
LQALLRFVRFGLPCDFRTTITIARIGGGPCGLARPARSSPQPGGPVVQRQPCRMRSRGEADRPGRSRAMPPPRIAWRRAIGPPAPGHGGRSAATLRCQISDVDLRECRQYPGLKGTRASANTSGPDSTLARRPLVKLRSPIREPAPNEENLFLLPDLILASEPAKITIRPLT